MYVASPVIHQAVGFFRHGPAACCNDQPVVIVVPQFCLDLLFIVVDIDNLVNNKIDVGTG